MTTWTEERCYPRFESRFAEFAKKKQGKRPSIFVIARHGTPEDVEVLASEGRLQVNAVDNEGYNALAYAAMSDNVAVAEALLKKGADPSLHEANVVAIAEKSRAYRVLFCIDPSRAPNGPALAEVLFAKAEELGGHAAQEYLDADNEDDDETFLAELEWEEGYDFVLGAFYLAIPEQNRRGFSAEEMQMQSRERFVHSYEAKMISLKESRGAHHP